MAVGFAMWRLTCRQVWTPPILLLLVPSPKSHDHIAAHSRVRCERETLRGDAPFVALIAMLSTGAATWATLIGVEAVLVELPPGPVAVSVTV